MSDAQPLPPATQPGTEARLYKAYQFKLIIQGVVQGHFTRVEGLGLTVTRILYREAGENSTVRMLPGAVEYSPVTLCYGLSDSDELLSWLFTAVNGRVERRNVSLAMLDDAGSSEI